MENNHHPNSDLYRIAHAVHKHITALPAPVRHLHLQPLNVQTPRRTSWWLVPSRQIPFYRFSKLFFHHSPEFSQDIIAGFSFERGLGGHLNGLVDSTLILQSDWYWRRFLNDIVAGLLTKSLNTIENPISSQRILIIELYNFNRLHRRLLETKSPDDILVFDLKKGIDAMELHRPGSQQLHKFNHITRCYDLALQIEMEADFAWYWLRFTFGVALVKDVFQNRTEDIGALWQNVLSPWMPLVG